MWLWTAPLQDPGSVPRKPSDQGFARSNPVGGIQSPPPGGPYSLDPGSHSSLLGAWGPCLSEVGAGPLLQEDHLRGRLSVAHLRLQLLKRICSETLRWFLFFFFPPTSEPWSLPRENGHYPFSLLTLHHNVPFSPRGMERISDHRGALPEWTSSHEMSVLLVCGQRVCQQ